MITKILFTCLIRDVGARNTCVIKAVNSGVLVRHLQLFLTSSGSGLGHTIILLQSLNGQIQCNGKSVCSYCNSFLDLLTCECKKCSASAETDFTA